LISNSEYGIYLDYYANHNHILHNNFLYNNQGGIQAADDGSGNKWNTDDLGNHWSDWTAPDEDKDGIVDVPYNINGTSNGKDHYPLVNPSGIRSPIANAGVDIEIDQHEIIKFDSSGCGYSYFIVNYTWNFTYNHISLFLYGSSPTFRFDITGMYMITLTVFNSLDQSSNDTMTVTVRDITPPMAEAGNNITIDQHETVTFNANKSTDNIGIINYRWIFIYDKLPRTFYGISTNFTFHDAGEYSIELQVIDAEGNWASDTIIVQVLDITPPVARAGKDQIIDQHEKAMLYGDKSSDNVGVINFTWSFNYNNTNYILYGESISFIFHIPGNHSVTLTVFDAMGNIGTVVVNITVLDITFPHADAGEDVNIDPDRTVHFNGNGSWDNQGIVNWTWIIKYDGNDITHYGSDLTFSFHKSGKYRVYLYVTDEFGNEAMDWLSVTVNEIEVVPKEDDDNEDTEPSDDDDNGHGEPSEDEEKKESSSSSNVILAILIGTILLISIVLLVHKQMQMDKRDGDEMDEQGRVEATIRPLEELRMNEPWDKKEDEKTLDAERMDDE